MTPHFFRQSLRAMSIILTATATPTTAKEPSPAAPRPAIALTLGDDDVIPTGNDWIALPAIRARDGALANFNVLSMRYRGLIEMAGDASHPVIAPFVTVAGVKTSLADLHWALDSYWIPTGITEHDGLETRITYVAAPGARSFVVRLQVTNHRASPVEVAPGLDVVWGAINRVTYAPAALTGKKALAPPPWGKNMEIFSYQTDNTQMAWAVSYGEGKATLHPSDTAPGLSAERRVTLAPNTTIDAHFTIAVGLDEASAQQSVVVQEAMIDRLGLDGVLEQAAIDAGRHVQTTGQPKLDLIMNRNLLFTTYYAWGRTLDTEQLVGVTSRSNRYYVSAAFWDRDALLWSFPALLDTDRARAREALDYVLSVQAANIGIHSRYIDGVVLEDGLELDELVAPIIALHDYTVATGDGSLFTARSRVIEELLARIHKQYDSATGLYATLQDAQDEYIKKPFSIYDNAIAWRALTDLAALYARTGNASASAIQAEADRLRVAIFRHAPRDGAKDSSGPILAAATDGHTVDFVDVPPGSLMKFPALGLIDERDPLFARTYAWLHSSGYSYSYSDKPFGLPGSYRLPFTTSWSVADHLRLTAGRAQALKILLASPWDGGIITEGINPETGRADQAGRAFATAAGYVGHTICATFCLATRTTQ